ncbi:MAG TPA: hypothetical protein VEZ14_11360 [Dehalococcoidia bacterium]|nr:hypothetical protein [Dehalococcoidia bacterium]
MKSVDARVHEWAFAVGDEVVVRLTGDGVFSLEHAALLPPAFCPGWTIADVLEHAMADGRRAYVVRFELGGETHVAVVDESAIEGTA